MIIGTRYYIRQINNQDKNDFWLMMLGTSGYLSSDFNMDGNVDMTDMESLWYVNSGMGCQVPE